MFTEGCVNGYLQILKEIAPVPFFLKRFADIQLKMDYIANRMCKLWETIPLLVVPSLQQRGASEAPLSPPLMNQIGDSKPDP